MLYTSTSKFFLAAVAAPMCLGLQIGGKDQEGGRKDSPVQLLQSHCQRSAAAEESTTPQKVSVESMPSMEDELTQELNAAEKLVNEFVEVVDSDYENAEKEFPKIIKKIRDETNGEVSQKVADKIIDNLTSQLRDDDRTADGWDKLLRFVRVAIDLYKERKQE